MEIYELLVDPEVSEIKFNREIAQYRELEDTYLQRGWWMLQANFPKVFMVFATPKPKPPAVVFGALLDFTNYDLWPPSVTLVDPFTRNPYKFKELPNQLLRGIPTQTTPEPGSINPAVPFSLMQAHGPDDIPFFCIPGVREYHQHPAHTGDSWLIHRGKGEGSLFHIIDNLYTYGVKPINGYLVQAKISIAGFTQGSMPA